MAALRTHNLHGFWRAFWTVQGRLEFARKSLAVSFLAIVILYPLLRMATSDVRIGIDLQEVRCLPWRVYLLKLGRPSEFARGSYVAFKPRGGLMGSKFEGRLVGKMVAGVPGDTLVVRNDEAYINGHLIGKLVLLPKLGAKSGAFDRRETVPEGKILVVGTDPRSYDGRYWGFLDQQDVIGNVSPVF